MSVGIATPAEHHKLHVHSECRVRDADALANPVIRVSIADRSGSYDSIEFVLRSSATPFRRLLAYLKPRYALELPGCRQDWFRQSTPANRTSGEYTPPGGFVLWIASASTHGRK